MPKSLSPELSNLLAELDAEFGKKKPSTSKPKTSASSARTEKEAPKGVSYSRAAGWIPIARVTRVIHQYCRCCGSSGAFIGGEYVRFKNDRSYSLVDSRNELCSTLFHTQELPDLVEEEGQFVARCFSCIELARSLDEIWDHLFEPQAEQLEIIL